MGLFKKHPQKKMFAFFAKDHDTPIEQLVHTITHLPPLHARSTEQSLAFTSYLADLSRELSIASAQADGTVAETIAKELRADIKALPKEFDTNRGSLPEVWWSLVRYSNDLRLTKSLTNPKTLSLIEQTIKKLPPSEEKAELYHALGDVHQRYRHTDASEDLTKYFAKVYEAGKAERLPMTPAPTFLSQPHPFAPGDMPELEADPRDVGAREDVGRLEEECERAREVTDRLIGLLGEARSGAGGPSAGLLTASYQACFHTQTELINHLLWAEALATHSVLVPLSTEESLADGAGTETTAQLVLKKLRNVTELVAKALEDFSEYERERQEKEVIMLVSERSRKETRRDRSQPIYETDGRLAIPLAGGSRSPSPSRREESSNAGRPPSANSCLSSTQHSYPNVHGPRSVSPHPFPNPLTPPSSYEQPIVRPRGPDDSNNRASSPRFRPLPIPGWTAGVDTGGKRKGPTELSGCQLSSESGSEEDELPVRPSAKALGKRRVIDDYEADDAFDPDDLYKTQDAPLRPNRTDHSSEDEDELEPGWVPRAPVKYVYDAAEERKKALVVERQRDAWRALQTNGLGSSASAPLSAHLEDSTSGEGEQRRSLKAEREVGRKLGEAHEKEGLGRKLSFWKK